mmetsp:Transcript_77/g.153  ORF Transcript_77/g.153 Transcript_77/m.153 type:complete len:225 (+) Transcript_77:2398-3072(+)
MVVGEDVRMYKSQHFLVRPRKVRADAIHKPFLARLAQPARLVGKSLARPEPYSLIALDHLRIDSLDNLNLSTWNVRSTALKHELVTGIHHLVVAFMIMDSTEPQRRVGRHHHERLNFAHKLFAWVEHEWLLLESDFALAMPELHLLMTVEEHCTILAAHCRVLNGSVAARGDAHHLEWTRHDALVFLSRERLWANLYPGHIAVVVKHMDILERFQSQHLIVHTH